ncbi:uncharacterized protein P884DRAFT_290183 [Thermothelomyces heterothallicus CBS 202.75]|uniref:uncharacterized protein n=1 Tax=Thermothelomyces heterothallicus CBS 202.75 TaxID=1149848 RepID=UPI00374372A1
MMGVFKDESQAPDADNQPTPHAVENKTEPATEHQQTVGEHATEMPPGGKPRLNTLRREVDLSSLLNSGEKTELTGLVGRVTESMLKDLTQLFDPVRPDGKAEASRTTFWSRLPNYLKDLSLGGPSNGAQARANHVENVKPSSSKKTGKAQDKRGDAHSAAGAPNREENDMVPRLQELKKEALLHFKKWQMAVNKRINDISVKRSSDSQPDPASAGSKKRPPLNKRGPKTASTPAIISLEADPVLVQLYPPVPTTLSSWPAEKRCLLLHALLLLLLSIENYGAYTRTLLQRMTSALQLPLRVLTEDEVRVCGALAQIAKDIPPEFLAPKRSEDGKPPKRWRAGLGGTSAATIPVSASGMAAALEAASIGSVLGIVGIPGTAAASLLGIMGENSLAAGQLFGIYGTRNPGKMMDHYLKDVGDFAFLPLRGSTGENLELGKVAPESRRLRVVLGISGWLTSKDDAISPWQCLGHQSEVYAVRWELDALWKLGSSFDTLVRSAAWSMAKKEIMARASLFANLIDSCWPESLLRMSKIIDNNWNNGMVRADKLGAALADVIMSKAQGERGVSLIGYSLGARAIYACLMCLAEKRAFGLVENAILIGTPAPSEPLAWCAMKSVVPGRLINVYSENDYILGFLYRTGSIEFGLAGLQRIIGVDGIENVDVTAKVSIHPRYQYLVGSILRHIGWEDTDTAQIARDEAEMSFYDDRNRKHEERRDAVELGKVAANKENGQGIIRTRMRKKNKNSSALPAPYNEISPDFFRRTPQNIPVLHALDLLLPAFPPRRRRRARPPPPRASAAAHDVLLGQRVPEGVHGDGGLAQPRGCLVADRGERVDAVGVDALDVAHKVQLRVQVGEHAARLGVVRGLRQGREAEEVA